MSSTKREGERDRGLIFIQRNFILFYAFWLGSGNLNDREYLLLLQVERDRRLFSLFSTFGERRCRNIYRIFPKNLVKSKWRDDRFINRHKLSSVSTIWCCAFLIAAVRNIQKVIEEFQKKKNICLGQLRTSHKWVEMRNRCVCVSVSRCVEFTCWRRRRKKCASF